MRVRHITFLVPFIVGVSAKAQCPLDAISNGREEFGSSVALDGDIAVVGFPAADGGGTDSGNAQVYRWMGSQWEREATLRPAERAEGDRFGSAVAVSGAVAVIGSEGVDCADGPNCGAAFVFRFDGAEWHQEAMLTRTERRADDLFGASVAISGNAIAVSAPGISSWFADPCDDLQIFPGDVHIFRFEQSGWALERTIDRIPPACAFGSDVSIDGNVLLIGAAATEVLPGMRRSGSAYIFRYDGTSWRFKKTLVASVPDNQAEFGSAVAIRGDQAVVGAPGQDCLLHRDCGAAYMFQRVGASWVQQSLLSRYDRLDDFGFDVAIDTDLVAIGVPGADPGFGVVNIYQSDGAAWFFQTTLTVPQLFPLDNPRLGSAVAVRGQVVLGAAASDGNVFSYAVIGSDCNENDTLDVCEGLAAPSFVEQRPACQCVPASSPAFGPSAVASNRFLSIEPGSAGRITALRVTVEALDPPHDALNGQTRWVGEPFEVTESSSVVDPADAPGAATFFAATLQCEPFYTDWSGYGTVHVLHPLIIPNGTYTVQAIDGQCPLASELDYSTPLELTGTRWGDAVGNCATIPCTAPNESVQILDAVAILQKFVNAPGAIAKYRADLDPGTPDLTITISDVLAALTGFQGLPYPFSPEEGGPCG